MLDLYAITFDHQYVVKLLPVRDTHVGVRSPYIFKASI